MNSSESISKIAPALASAQAEFKSVPKSGDNKFDKYRYAKLEDYVAAVGSILTKHKLAIVSSVDDVTALDDRTTKNGGCEHAARVKLTMRLLHESGEWIESHAWGEGQDRADKAVYKAITGARKYGIASMLGLATSDDPENDEGVGQPNGNKPAGEKLPEEVQRFVGAIEAALTARGWANADKTTMRRLICAKYHIKNVSDVPAENRDSTLETVKTFDLAKWKQDQSDKRKQATKAA